MPPLFNHRHLFSQKKSAVEQYSVVLLWGRFVWKICCSSLVFRIMCEIEIKQILFKCKLHKGNSVSCPNHKNIRELQYHAITLWAH